MKVDFRIIKNVTICTCTCINEGRYSRKLHILQAINIITEAWAQVKFKLTKICPVKAFFFISNSGHLHFRHWPLLRPFGLRPTAWERTAYQPRHPVKTRFPNSHIETDYEDSVIIDEDDGK